MTAIERDPPTCVTCRFFTCGDYGNTCAHPDAMTFDPIYGRETIPARQARQSFPPCGPAGRNWQMRPPRTAPTWLLWLIAAAVLAFVVRSLPWH
jgi:hypothetical protein